MALGRAFAKTRSAATRISSSPGTSKVGGERVKPAREVVARATRRDPRSARPPHRRRAPASRDRAGSATVAATLYEETPESREQRERLPLERRLPVRSAPISASGRRSRTAAASTRCGTPSPALTLLGPEKGRRLALVTRRLRFDPACAFSNAWPRLDLQRRAGRDDPRGSPATQDDDPPETIRRFSMLFDARSSLSRQRG